MNFPAQSDGYVTGYKHKGTYAKSRWLFTEMEEEDGSDAPRVKLWMASFVPFHKYLRLCETSALNHSVPAYVSHGQAFLVE